METTKENNVLLPHGQIEILSCWQLVKTTNKCHHVVSIDINNPQRENRYSTIHHWIHSQRWCKNKWNSFDMAEKRCCHSKRQTFAFEDIRTVDVDLYMHNRPPFTVWSSMRSIATCCNHKNTMLNFRYSEPASVLTFHLGKRNTKHLNLLCT